MAPNTSSVSLEPGSDPRIARIARLVGPNSISLVTTVSPDGVPNAAPFSFIMPCNYEPPMVCFVCGQQKHYKEFGYEPSKSDELLDTIKDTLVNIKATGEFVVTPVDRRLRSTLMILEKPWRYGTNELKKAGLTTAPATKVRVPLIREAKISLECRFTQMIPIRKMQLIIGEIVMIHAASETIVNGTPDVATIGPTFEGMHEHQYFELGPPITLTRHRPYDYDELTRE